MTLQHTHLVFVDVHLVWGLDGNVGGIAILVLTLLNDIIIKLLCWPGANGNVTHGENETAYNEEACHG